MEFDSAASNIHRAGQSSATEQGSLAQEATKVSSEAVVVVPGGFQKGHDPRRNLGGRVTAEIRAARQALSASLPDAIRKLADSLHCGDRRLEFAAAVEICNRMMGKPKGIDQEGDISERMRAMFDRARERMTEDQYLAVLEAITQSSE